MRGGDRDFEELSKDSDVDIVKLSENFERPSKDMIKKIAANSSSSSVSEKELLGAAGYLNDIPNSKNYVQDFEMLSDKFRKAGFLVTYPLDNDLEYVRVNYKEHGTVATMSLRHYLQDGIKIYDELVQKYKKDEPQNIKDHYRNSSIENEIMALAAHQLGHEGDLTKEQLEQIKLAIKIALAKNDK
ncbi:helix-turn-helix domain protein [Paenibacillus phage Ollie]|nr:helix-turn-helix domain protein [Paenibacillus phage Carlos]UYL92649.1 helix-turn-helix domain protein [Paenibacillus phage Ollie]